MRRKKGEQMSFRPTSRTKSPRRKIYLAAHISESVKPTRHPGGHVSVAADVTRPSPGDYPGYPGAGAHVPVRSSTILVAVHTRVYIAVVVSCAHVTRRRVSRVGERLSAVDCMMDASGLT